MDIFKRKLLEQVLSKELIKHPIKDTNKQQLLSLLVDHSDVIDLNNGSVSYIMKIGEVAYPLSQGVSKFLELPENLKYLYGSKSNIEITKKFSEMSPQEVTDLYRADPKLYELMRKQSQRV